MAGTPAALLLAVPGHVLFRIFLDACGPRKAHLFGNILCKRTRLMFSSGEWQRYVLLQWHVALCRPVPRRPRWPRTQTPRAKTTKENFIWYITKLCYECGEPAVGAVHRAPFERVRLCRACCFYHPSYRTFRKYQVENMGLSRFLSTLPMKMCNNVGLLGHDLASQATYYELYHWHDVKAALRRNANGSDEQQDWLVYLCSGWNPRDPYAKRVVPELHQKIKVAAFWRKTTPRVDTTHVGVYYSDEDPEDYEDYEDHEWQTRQG